MLARMPFTGPNEDRLAIRELIDTYADATNLRDAELWGSLFDEDARWELPDFPRAERWWEHGENLYVRHYAQAGFVPVHMSALQPHDVLLMRIAAPVVNHCAVLLQGNTMIHHLQHRLSERTVFGGWYRQRTALALRHERKR
jgi:hypothetical protein